MSNGALAAGSLGTPDIVGPESHEMRPHRQIAEGQHMVLNGGGKGKTPPCANDELLDR